mgnify:FL=1
MNMDQKQEGELCVKRLEQPGFLKLKSFHASLGHQWCLLYAYPGTVIVCGSPHI